MCDTVQACPFVSMQGLSLTHVCAVNFPDIKFSNFYRNNVLLSAENGILE